MKQTTIFTVLVLILSGCSLTAEKNSVSNPDQSEQPIGKKFFEYDQIQHYLNNIEEKNLGELNDNQSRSELDSIKRGVVLGNIPKDMSDLSFIDQLEKIGYSKREVHKSKFEAIDKIFAEKSVDEMVWADCKHVYRDVLLFRKNSKIIGVAKICFSCRSNIIIGTTANTENFGQNGDYEKLEKTLKK
ncbi:MAG: hypothetical protein K0S44_1561 [Bacteroidetes bacterium]|jgi:hypothetical protein|nr:hypothetical protein [Bacteroidota bacterium]